MSTPDEKAAQQRRLRASIQAREDEAMARFRAIIADTSFDLDPLCVYVLMDKLRGMQNSAGIPERSYKKAEQMLRVLGLAKHWGG
jgi:hypothetical protein